ncbi:hypothetical protein Q7P37_006169 [Cladosporium fusiforme]
MSALPSPINIPPSLFWDGNDGSWSTFHVQVGTPGQAVRLLPGTSASASDTTWVVRPEGCTQANPNLTHCDDERGLPFNPNKSSSWSIERLENDGLFELSTWYEGLLNLTGNAYYGFDTLTLGLPGSGLPSLSNQVIAGFADNNYWLGFLGLSPIPFNFSSQNDSTSMHDPQPAFLKNLQNQSLIPSLSWSYTAGAAYRDNPIFGSLVLGGHDTSRFEPNNVTFRFADDFSRDLTVYLRSISYDTLGSSLLTESIPISINSLVSHLWLPVKVCERFEEAFNLTWSEDAQLYLVDDAAHARLSMLSPTLTLTLGHEGSGGDTVEINLPYGAFDLEGSPPFVDPPSRYFPLKRAEKPEQYTLGRVFLQGAYVTADYDRQTFSVSQALFPDASKESNSSIEGIAPPGAEQAQAHAPALSKGVIAGIAVGAGLGPLLIAAALFWWFRQRNVTKAETADAHFEAKDEVDESQERGAEIDGRTAQLGELEHVRRKGGELDGIQTSLVELDPQGGKLELDGVQTSLVELDPQAGKVESADKNAVVRGQKERYELP